MEDDSKDWREEISDDRDRFRFWSEQSINQLGYSINLFTSIGIGLVSFLTYQREHFPELYMSYGYFVWDTTIEVYLFVYAIICLSVFAGFIAITSRLMDMRMTRRLTFVRLKSHEKDHGLPKGNDIDMTKECLICTWLRMVLLKYDELQEKKQYEGWTEFRTNVEEFRKKSKVLGALTWKAHEWQLSFLMIGLFLYGLIWIAQP